MSDDHSDSHSARLVRIETTLGYHNEMLQRLVQTAEKNTEFNGLLVAHVEESKRVWEKLEDYDCKLQTLQTSNAANCEFCNQTRKVFWWVLGFASLGLAYVIKFFVEHHGRT
jgi:hypothetical protein